MIPHAAAFLHQPQPGDVLQQAGRAADAAFVGEVQLQHRIVDDRLRRLDAHQGPGAEADVAPVGPHAGLAVGGHGHHRAGRIVRAGQHHLGRRQAALGRHVRPQRPQRRARLRDRAENPRRQRELAEQFRRPVALDRIVTLARAGVGHLVALHAGQQPVEQVGHHQQRFGDVQQRRARELHRQQLEQRVELHELQAGMAEDLLAADDAEGLGHRVVGAAVAVMVGIAEQLVAASEQAEVDAPGVDADAGDVGRRICRRRPASPWRTCDHWPSRSQYRWPATSTGPFSKR